MAKLIKKSADTPHETRAFEAGKRRLDLVTPDGAPIGSGTFEAGWRWSEHVKPIAGTDGCQAAHRGCVVSGRMTVRMDDDEEMESGPGDVTIAVTGHDAWSVGDEACVLVDWQGATNYAKR